MPELDFRAPRLFVDAPLGAGQAVALERNQSNYLGNVLRLAAGETVLVFNGRDGEWQARIAGRKRPDSLEILDHFGRKQAFRIRWARTYFGRPRPIIECTCTRRVIRLFSKFGTYACRKCHGANLTGGVERQPGLWGPT